ncbi:MAG TPA: stage V sporulation protein AC [Clostridia bacterium]|nr:stage V sporulation protein AC [Clostridia bacterium]
MTSKKPATKKELEYQKLVSERAPKSKVLVQCLQAFVSGGLICCVGQLFRDFARLMLKLDETGVSTFTAIVMVFIGATLTGVGVYDRIGSWAGAGSVVPITGFANSIVAPAMEFRREGYVLGLGAKLFTLAGPVLVYGISASIIVGLISLLF